MIIHQFIQFFICFCLLTQYAQANETQIELKPQGEKQYFLSVAAIFKNEADYFKEWIEYYKLLGVEHFYLYDNGSSDNYRDVLAPYLKDGFVTVTDWPNRPTRFEDPSSKHQNWVYATQVSAYEHAIALACGTSQWIALIDNDEYILPLKTDTIPGVLAKYDKAPAVSLFWQNYGTNHVQYIPDGKLMIELLNRTDTTDPFLTTNPMKVILKPEEYVTYDWPPHRFKYKNDQQAITIPIEEMRVNHYVNRTVSYFQNVKIKNRQDMEHIYISDAEREKYSQSGNKMEDTERSIHRFVPELRRRMGFDKG